MIELELGEWACDQCNRVTGAIVLIGSEWDSLSLCRDCVLLALMAFEEVVA